MQEGYIMRASGNVWVKLACVGMFVLIIINMFNIHFDTGQYKDTETTSQNALSGEVSCERGTALWAQTLDFDKLSFSNETGNPTGCYIVPNYIHFVRFGEKPVTYVELICILAAFKNQRPEKIFFHYNKNHTFSGKYWDVLEKLPEFMNVVVFNEVELPTEIFEQEISKGWQQWHGSDITRIRMIMTYGGIFLDNDCYLIKSVDDFRRFEIAMNWDEDQFLGSQVIIAHKDARFLKRWLECYKVYDKTKWYYNAGERPTQEILFKEPELIHRVKELFGAKIDFVFKVFQQQWSDWKNMYIVHLLANHQYLLKNVNDNATYPIEFNEKNIGYYPITFREMAYDVYDIANVQWPKTREIA